MDCPLDGSCFSVFAALQQNMSKSTHHKLYQTLGTTSATAQEIGGKAVLLCAMAELGLPVPPGFVLTFLASRKLAEKATAPEAASPKREIAAEISIDPQRHICGTSRAFGQF